MNYYNEFDPKAAAWLRELINLKLIPQGEVDTRSIKDVRADDLRGFTQCHFFAGVSGWELALQLAGWPEDRPVWTGSCPCQSFSSAGKQKGANDERDLWPVFFDLIRSCRPEFVFGEQVEAAIKHGWLDRVCANMEAEEYTVGAVVLGAHSVSAPHLRQRLYWGATRLVHTKCNGRGGGNQADSEGEQRTIQAQGLGDDCGLADGNGQRFDGVRVSNEQGAQGSKVMRSSKKYCPHCDEWYPQTSWDWSDGLFCPDCGKPVADTCEQRLQGYTGDVTENSESRRLKPCPSGPAPASSLSGLSPWSDFGLVYCKDHKIRRIPSESLLLSVADGISEGMDEGRNCGVLEVERGFPLCKKEKEIGRTMLLKGYGNAVVPQVAAEFIRAFEEEI